MKLEDQVVSFELAKKMRELGFKQKSLFYWIPEKVFCPHCGSPKVKYYLSEVYVDLQYDKQYYTWYSAYTVAELGEILPIGHQTKRCPCKHEYIWKCWNFFDPYNNQYANTEANARVKRLIWLKENDLLEG